MAKLIAALLLVAALIAAASSQYLAGYRGVGLAYGGYRGAYAGAPVGLGYAGLGHPGYLGAYGAYRGAYLG